MAAQLALVVTDTTAPSYDATPRLAHQVAGVTSLVTLRFSPFNALRRLVDTLVLRLLPARSVASVHPMRQPVAIEAPGSHLRLVR